jgi:hypothetical protein
MRSTASLTDTQHQILSAASLRDDRCLVLPKTLKGGAAQKVVAKLISIGIVREINAKNGWPFWRRDVRSDQTYSLKLTAAGLKAIATDKNEASIAAVVETLRRNTKGAPKNTKVRAPANAASPALTASSSAIREGTKIAQVLALLQRDQGARLDELISATGWLPHTARAALTGLRHRGFAVRLERGVEGGASVYRATSGPAAIAL